MQLLQVPRCSQIQRGIVLIINDSFLKSTKNAPLLCCRRTATNGSGFFPWKFKPRSSDARGFNTFRLNRTGMTARSSSLRQIRAPFATRTGVKEPPQNLRSILKLKNFSDQRKKGNEVRRLIDLARPEKKKLAGAKRYDIMI